MMMTSGTSSVTKTITGPSTLGTMWRTTIFQPGTPAWAREFDDWAKGALERWDVDALLDFQARAPGARIALPTWEHYAPVLVAAGAVLNERPQVTFPITGFWNDSAFTRRSVQLG